MNPALRSQSIRAFQSLFHFSINCALTLRWVHEQNRSIDSPSNPVQSLQISLKESTPQDICPICQYEIETAILLQKRIKLTEAVWSEFSGKQPSPDDHPVSNDPDIILSCHVCGLNCDHDGLQNHIQLEHGDTHLFECKLCCILLGESMWVSQ